MATNKNKKNKIPKAAGSEDKKNKKIFQTPKGMHDIFPFEWPFWERFQRTSKEIAEFYNFSRIETPILEDADLFIRGVGEGTDIVEKEFFVFKTKGGDCLALRPEMTAPVVRSYIQNNLHRLPQPAKLYYSGPVFRHENPQAGRYREFNQFGLEIIGGESDSVYDAQIIIAAYRLLEDLKIKNLVIQINSIGCKTCRPNYRRKLLEYYKKQEPCKDCERRIETNPLRVLDCKNKICAPIKTEAPSVLDSLCVNCKSQFKKVLEYLEEVSLPYSLNPHLVRGLDYYSRTVFEIFTEGSELTLAAGGRYDYLAELLGGKPVPGVGVAVGIERIIDVMKMDNDHKQPRSKSKIFLVHIGDMTKLKSLALIEEFRRHNIPVIEALGKDSLSPQLERAAKIESPLALIFGQKEAYEESIIIRDMVTGVQESVPLAHIVEEVKRRLH